MKRAPPTTKKTSGSASVKPARGKVSVVSEKTRWSCCMQGADPCEVDDGILDGLTAAFGPRHPQWLIASRPWRRITGAHFKELRLLLRMTRRQCAAFLRLNPKTVERWETGRQAPAFAAFEALRLTLDTVHARASHRAWDGWFISRDGEWISPNVGNIAMKPWELDRWPQLLADLSRLRFEKDRLMDELAEAAAENTRLRQLFQAQGVTRELRRMHDRIGDLLAGIGTAEIIDYPPATAGAERRNAA